MAIDILSCYIFIKRYISGKDIYFNYNFVAVITGYNVLQVVFPLSWFVARVKFTSSQLEGDYNHFNIASKIFIGVTKNMVMRSKNSGNCWLLQRFFNSKTF